MALQLRSFVEEDEVPVAPSAAVELELGIRDAIHRDRGPVRRPILNPVPGRSSQESADTSVLVQRSSGQTAALVHQMSNASVEEIEKVISHLQEMRQALQEHAAHVQRELTGYATTSRSALTSLKSVSDSLAQWKPTSA